MSSLLLLLVMGCDGSKDGDPVDCAIDYFIDADGDGVGDEPAPDCDPADDRVTLDGDCDDDDASIYPGASELCDGLDNNCDGVADEGATLTVYADADGDGFGDDGVSEDACEAGDGQSDVGGDCDDADGAVYPGASEICGDGILNDCDGSAVEVFAECGLSGDNALADADGSAAGGAASLAGWSVAGAGDVDGDGLHDVLIGAPGANQAHLAYGSTSGGLSLAEVLLTGAAGDGAGTDVDGAGDLDGDGYADLIIGAPYEASAGEDAGAAYLLMGADAAAGSLVGGRVLLGEDQFHYAGIAVSGAGDIDGDGVDDVLVGADGEDSGESNAGTVYAVTGLATKPTSLADVSWRISGDRINGSAGSSVDSAGDTDGDGINDIIIGSPNDPRLEDFGGAAFLVRGPVIGDMSLADADATLLGEGYINYAGVAVAGAGDLDGDGLDDLAVGADGAGETGFFTGAVYLVGGGVSGEVSLADADATLRGEDAANNAGAAVAGAGDTNADGLGDLIVGAYKHNASTGAAYLILGGPELAGELSLVDASARFLGEGANDRAGGAVDWAGDYNGDGADDLLIGADGYDSESGAAYLYLGGGL